MFRIMLSLYFLILPSAFGASLDELKTQTKESLYFVVPVQSYEVVEKAKINLKVQLLPYDITVITDRPYRKKESVKASEFIDYIKGKQQKDLVFTLSIKKNNQPFFFNFQKQSIHFYPETQEIIFKDIRIPKNILDQLEDLKTVNGTKAILTVEG